MPETRFDPITETTVIVAPERLSRPQVLTKDLPDGCVPPKGTSRVPTAEPTIDAACPFCLGNEALTPQEIAAYPPGKAWQVRVVPNRYPALAPPAEFLDHRINPPLPPYQVSAAEGFHEVIIEAPLHVLSLSDLPCDHIALILTTYADRLRWLKQQPRVAFVQIFKNQGAKAGATMPHLHSQVIAWNHVPTATLREIAACGDFYRQHGRCVFCHLLDAEQTAENRIVEASDDFVVLCPYVSRLPFETTILPRRHLPSFDETDAETLRRLATVLRRTLIRWESQAEQVAYNLMLHSAPFDMGAEPHYHWQMKLLPRFAQRAGFEWSTGVYMNPLTPEQAAQRLRAVKL